MHIDKSDYKALQSFEIGHIPYIIVNPSIDNILQKYKLRRYFPQCLMPTRVHPMNVKKQTCNLWHPVYISEFCNATCLTQPLLNWRYDSKHHFLCADIATNTSRFYFSMIFDETKGVTHHW